MLLAHGVAMPTNGNAGAAWAVYAARAGLRGLIAMPVSAPAITRAECAVTGAELYLVDGLIGDAGKLVNAAVWTRPGYQEVSTHKEPYRLEGRKTMGYEIAEQLNWRLPSVPFENAHTIAFGITVPKALGVFLVLEAVRATEARSSPCPTKHCSLSCASWPERACSSVRRAPPAWRRHSCGIRAGCAATSRSSCSTGTGLKYPETVTVEVPTLAIDAEIPAERR